MVNLCTYLHHFLVNSVKITEKKNHLNKLHLTPLSKFWCFILAPIQPFIAVQPVFILCTSNGDLDNLWFISFSPLCCHLEVELKLVACRQTFMPVIPLERENCVLFVSLLYARLPHFQPLNGVARTSTPCSSHE